MLIALQAKSTVGLSPLTRGNPHYAFQTELGGGPIPAHAGQPTTLQALDQLSKAYPRSRGATEAGSENCERMLGLSPLTRGNLDHALLLGQRLRPIPAHAGQPLSDTTRSAPVRAYPRSRGATLHTPKCRSRQWGLSPLTRGNHVKHLCRALSSGPIPAHAGQPLACVPKASSRRAYPRSRGATTNRGNYFKPGQGLSPLTRGNRKSARQCSRWRGPIPAHAGQPWRPLRCCRLCRAYPRSRGATGHQHHPDVDLPGLSPLTRGNPIPAGCHRCKPGPIPAHAGQPRAYAR